MSAKSTRRYESASLSQYLDIEEKESQKVQRNTVKRLLMYIFKYHWLLALGAVLILLGTAASLAEPGILGYAIDEAIVPKRLDLVKRFALLFLFVECVRVSSMIAQSYLFEVLGQKVMQGLRIRVISHLQTLPMSIYDKNPAGRLVTRVTNDVSALAEMFTFGFVMIFANILTVIGIFITLLVLNFKLGLISALVFPVLIGSSMYFSAKLRVTYRSARSKLSALNAFLAENILGTRVVHLFNRQSLHAKKFETVNQWYTDAQIGTIRVFALFQPTITWCSGISVALVLYFGGLMTLDGSLKLGVLVAYFSYAFSLFQPVREIADKWNIYLSGMASAERIFSILDWEPELGSPDPLVSGQLKPALPLKELKGHIVFENIWFAYDGGPGEERWVLKDFNLEILPGMQVGIVGHTGAGKTTLINLLMRFYEPQKGRILLDGKELKSYDKRDLRASIGIVQQDVFLFSGSVEDNVLLWRKSEELEPEILKQSLQKTLQRLGLERSQGEELDERGTNLSMGERQVVAFARALAANPKIWILDEATSNVDSSSEMKLNGLLSGASQGKTSLLIAHRLSTVSQAHLILVLHKGVLVEKGTHATLMAENGVYARLYRYQSRLPESGSLAPLVN